MFISVSTYILAPWKYFQTVIIAQLHKCEYLVMLQNTKTNVAVQTKNVQNVYETDVKRTAP